ncbi:MAG: large-conductance mechanosensitive channel protein MscL [Crocinitomicaceae bacterium]
MLKEFKAFISKGNVLDLAVGLIMATYFGAIVKSMVDDLLMPIVGNLVGGVDFKEMKYVISEAVMDAEGIETAAEVSVNYGMFINHIITFVIVAFAVFMIVKGYNKMKKKEEEAPAPAPGPTKDQELLTEIRDLLKK